MIDDIKVYIYDYSIPQEKNLNWNWIAGSKNSIY
jgi:hypothetical protein